MKSSDQADSGGDWRVQLQDMRTVSALRAGLPQADEVERLSDRALRAAASNPDHSEAARAAAAEALRARRLSPEPWRVRVPGFLSAADLARGDALFFGAAHSTRRASAAIGLVLLIVLLVLFFLPVGLVPAIEISWSDIQIDAMLGALLVVPMVLAFLTWFALSILCVKPARIAVVRPIEALSHTPLRRAVTGELRPYGHVIALSGDQTGAAVRSAAHYRARAAELGNLFALNFANMGTRRETLALSASDAWRPLVLNLLLDSCDAIVVDLSDGGSWALEAIKAEGVAARCVFVALWGKLEAADAALRAAGLSQRCFPYAPDGEMQRRPQFRAAMLAAMRATHGVAP